MLKKIHTGYMYAEVKKFTAFKIPEDVYKMRG